MERLFEDSKAFLYGSKAFLKGAGTIMLKRSQL